MKRASSFPSRMSHDCRDMGRPDLRRAYRSAWSWRLAEPLMAMDMARHSEPMGVTTLEHREETTMTESHKALTRAEKTLLSLDLTTDQTVSVIAVIQDCMNAAATDVTEIAKKIIERTGRRAAKSVPLTRHDATADDLGRNPGESEA